MLTLSAELSRRLIARGSPGRIFVLFRITAPSVEVSRKPLNIAVALDRSGSMKGGKLDYVKHATAFLFSQLLNTDIFSLVTFNHLVQVPFPAGEARERDAIRRAISSIEPQGMTNLSGGWLAALQEVLKHSGPERLNRIILLTDGIANEGITDPSRLFNIGAHTAEKGAVTTAMGVGSDFAEDLLKGIAEAGHGNYYFIDNPEKAPRTFSEELMGLLALYAQNLTIEFTPSENVQFVDLHHDFPLTMRGKGCEISLGDLYGGDERTVLIECLVTESPADGIMELGKAKLAYHRIHEEISRGEVSLALQVTCTDARAAAAEAINPAVEREIVICDAINARRKAVREADQGSFSGARKKLSDSISGLQSSVYSHDETVSREIEKLEGLLGSFSDSGSYQSIGRKEALYQSFYISRKKGHSSVNRTRIIGWNAVEALKNARSVTVITGAGLPMECSIPGVRGVTELIEGEELMIFNAETFSAHPDAVWKRIRTVQEEVIRLPVPECYRIIAEMEEFWKDFRLITENVDGMHSIAGNTGITELFGNIFKSWCPAEKKAREARADRKCACGATLRPAVRWLGEELEDQVLEQMRGALTGRGIIFLIGTHFRRNTELIVDAARSGATLVEINAAETAFSSLAAEHIRRDIRSALPELWTEVKR
ncbi:MAG: VWA domain-containing protein [Candidatus Eremiobacteraeota bacterium]|nr:VWA domain-containing protein [Candidatus Eremiobacteraeota bacterium]